MTGTSFLCMAHLLLGCMFLCAHVYVRMHPLIYKRIHIHAGVDQN